MNDQRMHETHSTPQGSLTLILGGVRSGKSRFAQDLAESIGRQDVLFVATAEAGDAEMSERIRRHRRSRPAGWKTLECPLCVGNRLANLDDLPGVVLVDCLTLLVSNVMFQHESAPADLDSIVSKEVNALIQVVQQRSTQMLIVSGEVGSGVVPESAMGRRFRDLLGFANQQLAARCRATYLMVAGHAIDAKRLSTSVTSAARDVVTSSGVQS